MLASPSQQGGNTNPFFLSSEDSYRWKICFDGYLEGEDPYWFWLIMGILIGVIMDMLLMRLLVIMIFLKLNVHHDDVRVEVGGKVLLKCAVENLGER